MNFFRLACASVACLFASDALAAPVAADDDIIGYYAFDKSYNVGPAGELVVTRSGGTWRASIAKLSVDGQMNGSEVRFTFAGDNGSYRGHLSADGQSFDGMWRRREVTEDPRYAAGEAQGYAMPVMLTAVGTNEWRGTVTPLPDTLHLYLKIFRGPDGKLLAAIRNPETHEHGDAMQYEVTRDRDTIRLSGNDNGDEPKVITATLQHRPERIRMNWAGAGGVIELAARTPVEVPGFFPKPWGSPPYVYFRPPATDDGWETASANDVGLDESALARGVQRIIDINPAGSRAWLVHSFVVAYRGKLVLDEYFYGYDRNTPHDMRSAGKTFGSVMVGAVMLHGGNISPRSRIYELAAPMAPFANPDPRKAQITLAHVMTHTTGLACDDNMENPLSPGNEDTMQSQRAQPNWWKFTLDLPMAHDPGTVYAYCSGAINLTGMALTMATHKSVPELFNETVARPLQWKNWYWNTLPTGEGYLGGGTFVRPRDFLKLGQVFLDGGVWHGTRIVSADWVKESTRCQQPINEETTGRHGDDFANVYIKACDGFAWHLYDMVVGARTYHTYFANGNGGQMLFVVPELDLAVVFTAGNYGQGVWWRLRDAFIRDTIIPAIPK